MKRWVGKANPAYGPPQSKFGWPIPAGGRVVPHSRFQ